MHILDNLTAIKKLDSKKMLGSLQLLGQQVLQIWRLAGKLKVPAGYKQAQRVVVLGMGGSALGAHIIKSVFGKNLKVPLEIINDYGVPVWVDAKTLVIASSYSGTTEEVLHAVKEAARRKAKVAVICAGGELKKLARAKRWPGLFFTTENNPCGSPRMGLGYSIVGQIILFSKIGLLKLTVKELKEAVRLLSAYETEFGVFNDYARNKAKQMAGQLTHKTVWFAGAEHLSGNAHAAANQMNENAKRFAGYFLIPELNHHLMEGLLFPKSNHDNLFFVLFESRLYDGKITKRFAVTKEILEKNNIACASYVCRSKKPLLQALEVLVFHSYLSYYSAILEKIDPTAIPFVDYFKKQLNKGR